MTWSTVLDTGTKRRAPGPRDVIERREPPSLLSRTLLSRTLLSTALPYVRRRSTFEAWLPRLGVLICAALAVLTSSRSACAAAGQWQAGGRVGVAWLDGPRVGPSAEAFLRRGLGDALELDLQLLTSLHPFQPDTKMPPGTSSSSPELPWVLGFAPGLLYRWDVLRAIPYAGAGLGVYAGDGLSSGWNGTQFGAVARTGVEWLLNRDVVLSVQASAHLALTESPIPAPLLQLTAGASYAWGW